MYIFFTSSKRGTVRASRVTTLGTDQGRILFVNRVSYSGLSAHLSAKFCNLHFDKRTAPAYMQKADVRNRRQLLPPVSQSHLPD